MSYENDGAAPSDENERVRLRCVDIDQNAEIVGHRLRSICASFRRRFVLWAAW